jgi:hypothetical protein
VTHPVTAAQVARGLIDTCQAARHPLTPDQEILIYGAMAVWHERILQDERDELTYAIGGPMGGAGA